MTEEFDVDPYREELARVFAAHDVVLPYLFGSQAAGVLSDVDVAVLFGREALVTDLSSPWVVPAVPPAALENVQKAIKPVLGEQACVVALNDAPPCLGFEVVRSGEVACEKEAGNHAEFASLAMSRYCDYKAWLEVHGWEKPSEERRGRLNPQPSARAESQPPARRKTKGTCNRGQVDKP